MIVLTGQWCRRAVLRCGGPWVGLLVSGWVGWVGGGLGWVRGKEEEEGRLLQQRIVSAAAHTHTDTCDPPPHPPFLYWSRRGKKEEEVVVWVGAFTHATPQGAQHLSPSPPTCKNTHTSPSSSSNPPYPHTKPNVPARATVSKSVGLSLWQTTVKSFVILARLCGCGGWVGGLDALEERKAS